MKFKKGQRPRLSRGDILFLKALALIIGTLAILGFIDVFVKKGLRP
jgi:hypothetical protein